MEGQFEAKIGKHPKSSSISIDGHELPYIRGFKISSHIYEGPSKVNIEMLATKPFIINGEGEITIDTIVVSELVARQVYESLKKIFENKMEDL